MNRLLTLQCQCYGSRDQRAGQSRDQNSDQRVTQQKTALSGKQAGRLPVQ